MVTKLIPILLLAAKWCVAFALIFALTMPFTTCTSRGKVHDDRIDIAFENAQILLCFFWPIPLLIVRSIWKNVRMSIPIAVLEILFAIGAWIGLSLSLAMAVVVTFGGLSPGSGYDLASRSLIGYGVLSLFELVTNVRSRPRRPSLQSVHAAIDPVPQPRA